MGRIRTIKPELPQSESIGNLSRDARLLFIQLWTIVDDSGRTRASSRMLASLLYPYDEDAPKLMPQWLAELEKQIMIRRYVSDGNSYLEITNWLKHQKIDRPTPSRIPPFTCSSRGLDEDSRGLDDGPWTVDRGQGSVPPTLDPHLGSPKESALPDGTSDAKIGSKVVLDEPKTPASAKKTKGDPSPECLILYKAYPKHSAPNDAYRAIAKALTIKPFEYLLLAVNRYAKSVQGKDPKYIPYPASWFNAGHYDDEISAPLAPTSADFDDFAPQPRPSGIKPRQPMFPMVTNADR